MNSLGSLHFSLIEIRRLDGNDALGHVHCPHPLISNQSPLCWLTRRIWSIIRTIRCMESTLYTSITVQRFPTACLPNYCVYMTNCRLMCSSRRFITTPSQTPGPRVPAAARVTDKVYCLFLLNLYRGTDRKSTRLNSSHQ